MYVLYSSNEQPGTTLPIYHYSEKHGFENAGKHFFCDGITFLNLQVEARLSERVFGIKWPNELSGLKPDITIHIKHQVHLIEVKTIGTQLTKNGERYDQVCKYLSNNGFDANLYYLLSRGHENKADWKTIASAKPSPFNLILWEDVLRQASGTPLARLFDIDLNEYTLAPQ